MTVAGTMRSIGLNDVFYESQPVVVFGPEHAKMVADGGYSKADVKRYLHEHAQMPLGSFSRDNAERRFRRKFGGLYTSAGPDTMIPVVRNVDDLIVVVIGGAGKHSAFIPTFGATRSVTRALKLRDGGFASSVAEFRRG
jgi:hypothetical protein